MTIGTRMIFLFMVAALLSPPGGVAIAKPKKQTVNGCTPNQISSNNAAVARCIKDAQNEELKGSTQIVLLTCVGDKVWCCRREPGVANVCEWIGHISPTTGTTQPGIRPSPPSQIGPGTQPGIATSPVRPTVPPGTSPGTKPPLMPPPTGPVPIPYPKP